MIKTKFLMLVAAGLVSLIGILAEATVQAETLSEALAKAYSTNPSLLAQQTQLRAVDETVSQALSNWRPNVTLSGDIEREYTRLNTRRPTEPGEDAQKQHPRRYSALFRGFRTINGQSRAEANVQAARDLKGLNKVFITGDNDLHGCCQG